MSNLGITQAEAFEWSRRNFGETLPPIAHVISPFLGMVEELGEIAHSILKLSQGIRGTREQHEADIRDGIGDLLIFTLDFCSRNGMNCEQILDEVWGRVKARDWKRYPDTGLPGVATVVPASGPKSPPPIAVRRPGAVKIDPDAPPLTHESPRVWPKEPVARGLGHCARCTKGKALNEGGLCAECAKDDPRMARFLAGMAK